jgi:hypothetical protein
LDQQTLSVQNLQSSQFHKVQLILLHQPILSVQWLQLTLYYLLIHLHQLIQSVLLNLYYLLIHLDQLIQSVPLNLYYLLNRLNLQAQLIL